MNNEEYQKNEIARFNSEKHCYFDNINQFIESLKNGDQLTDLNWIENGSYGAGACLVLQRVVNSLNSQTNDRARIGNILFRCLYGRHFRGWNKLPEDIQTKLNVAVDAWLGQEHNFAITLII